MTVAIIDVAVFIVMAIDNGDDDGDSDDSPINVGGDDANRDHDVMPRAHLCSATAGLRHEAEDQVDKSNRCDLLLVAIALHLFQNKDIFHVKFD